MAGCGALYSKPDISITADLKDGGWIRSVTTEPATQGPRAVVKLRSAEVGEKYPTKIATQAPTGEDWTSDISQGQQAVNLFVVSSDRRYGKFTLQVYTSNTLTETTAITVTEATNE